MGYFTNYLEYIRNKGNSQLATSIQKTVSDVAPQYLENFFFFQVPKAKCISIIDNIKNPLLVSIQHHLLVASQVLPHKNVCNFLIHPSVRKAVHTKFESDVKNTLIYIKNNLDNLLIKEKFKSLYAELTPIQSDLMSFDVLYSKLTKIIEETKVIVMNGNNAVSSDEYATGSNIIIGGNTLGRGVTFPALQTIYYTRTAKNPQADTMWQHKFCCPM